MVFFCVVIANYYNCGCRMAKLNFCTSSALYCSHPAPYLIVSGIPHGCNSIQVSGRHWNRQRPAPRGPACVAENPDLEGFNREEDTAGRLDQLELCGLVGLGNDQIDQVLPRYVKGSWRAEVMKLYKEFKASHPVPSQQPATDDKKEGNEKGIDERPEDPGHKVSPVIVNEALKEAASVQNAATIPDISKRKDAGVIGDCRSASPSSTREATPSPSSPIATFGCAQAPVAARFEVDKKTIEQELAEFRRFSSRSYVTTHFPSVKEFLGSAQLLKGSDPDDKEDRPSSISILKRYQAQNWATKQGKLSQ